MDPTGYLDDHNFFEFGYCGHTQFPYSKIFLDQASALILSQFQEEDHPFIKKALQNEHIHVVSLYYVYKPKTDTPITKNTEDDENAYKLGPKYGGESIGLHRNIMDPIYKRFHLLPYFLLWVCLSLVCKHNVMKLHEYPRLEEPF